MPTSGVGHGEAHVAAGREVAGSRHLLAQRGAMVSVPPFGMASRAFTARLSSASSIWLASAEAGGSPRQVEI